MKCLYTLVLCFFAAGAATAQQQEQFTQFMYAKTAFNPGAVGSEPGGVVAAIVRNQWLGIEGAPETQMLTLSLPRKEREQRAGLGAQIIRQSIGLSQNYELSAAYSYRLEFSLGYLRLGLQGSARLLRTDFSRATAIQPIESDGAIPAGIQSKIVPNFGAGFYYQDLGERFYLGLGVPRLLQVNIDLADEEGVISREIRHFYIMSGARIGLGDDGGVELRPNVLMKVVSGAPFDADINLTAVFADRFSTGVSYRTGGSKTNSLGESVSLLVGVDIGEKLMFGLSYDATLSEFRRYNNGSVEGMVRYRLAGKATGDPGKSVDGRRNFYR